MGRLWLLVRFLSEVEYETYIYFLSSIDDSFPVIEKVYWQAFFDCGC